MGSYVQVVLCIAVGFGETRQFWECEGEDGEFADGGGGFVLCGFLGLVFGHCDGSVGGDV